MTRRLLVTAAIVGACPAAADDYYVYFLGGQSNMVGYGSVAELPPFLRKPVDGARIYNGKEHEDQTEPTGFGVWTDVVPGYGFEWEVTEDEGFKPSHRFGCELSFARTIRELRPDEKVALIKYARGATSIDYRAAWWGCWDPNDPRGEGEFKGVNQYHHALATIKTARATRDIDGDGTPDRLIPAGILWMQGESDAGKPEIAADYEENLTELMGLLREAFAAEGQDPEQLPVVIARVSDAWVENASGGVWKFGNEVREAQHAFVDKDPNAAIVTETDTYGYSEPAHYDTLGYLDMGEDFAEAVHKLRSR